MVDTSRTPCHTTLTLTGDEGTCPPIPYNEYSGGTIHLPTGSQITALTFYTAPHAEGEYAAAYGGDGNAVTLSSLQGGRSYPIPSALFGAGSLKAVVTGGTAGPVSVSLKG